jgi:mediator of RNA polymerase II transcription subunit 8, fungi type
MSFTLLSHNLRATLDTINTNSAFLSSAQVYPNPHIPGTKSEMMLNYLLRKKIDPSAEDWVAEARRLGSGIGKESEDDAEDGQTRKDPDAMVAEGESKADLLSPAELKECWKWALPVVNKLTQKLVDAGSLPDFSFEEQQNGVESVVTGLRRKLWEDESESEGDEDGEDKMEGVEKAKKTEDKVEMAKPMMPMDSMFKFMSTGSLPSSTPGNSQVQGGR